MSKNNLEQQILAILFVAAEPVSSRSLAKALQTDSKSIDSSVQKLEAWLADSGLQLISKHKTYYLVTSPDAKEAVERYLGAKVQTDLSKPALEVLAIVAYKQPLTKSEIEKIRGVASDQTVKNLLLRGLIMESGVSDEPGHPVLYSTSMKFMQILGLRDLSEMPPLEEL